jgi:Domain of unknown function (DUF3817)
VVVTDSARPFRTVAVVEALTLVVLLVNLATVHLDGLAAAVGPVHGSAYLVAIAMAWSARLPGRARLLTLVPGVGALLAVRSTAAAAPQEDT